MRLPARTPTFMRLRTAGSRARWIASLVMAASPIAAQRAPAITQAGGPATAARADDKRAMTVADYAKWRAIRDVSISDDGTWASYAYQQRRVDDTLFIENLTAHAEWKVPRASRVQFSDDSKWVAYSVAEALRANAPETDTPANGPARLELKNLATGATQSWDNVASFAFSKGSVALMIRKARPGAPPDAGAGRAGAGGAPGGGRGGRGGTAPVRVDGTDLILHHLRDGADELIGSVSAAEFNKPGTMLAYTVSAADRDGNGLFVLSTTNWQRRSLDNARADYTRLTWDDSGTSVAALRGMDRRGFTEKENALVAVASLESAEPASFVLDRKALSGLADSMVISEKGTLSWSTDHSRVFVGLKGQEASPPRRDSTVAVDPVGNVDVWHWKDPYIQPVQMVRAQQDRNRTFTAAVLLAQKKLVPIADARMDRVQITRDGAWAIGQDDKDYVDDWKPQLADFYSVNTTTGERTPVLKGQERSLGLSPDGKYFLYWKDKQVWSYDIAAKKHVAITQSAPVSFVNADEDHVGEKPAYGVSGFTKDGKSVVLDHKFDLWLVSLDGSGTPRNLTNGTGAKSDTRFRYVRLDPDENAPAGAGGGFGGGGGRGGGGGGTIDLSKPMLLSAFNEQDKKAGYYRLDGDQLTKLVLEDRGFGRPIKAKNADRVLFTRETFAEFPDYWVTNSRFENPKRLTEANPQQAQFKWGHRVLIDYKDKDGHKLQGTLAVPDDYQPGQKLPMLVYFYEKLSDQQNHYEVPRYASGPQYADYVSNGYLVLLPDIYFHTGRSHTDMLNSVEAAVKRVEDLGYADPKRVGLHGGSYSGQGGAYISTQSKMFAAISIRAAAVDLIADFNQLWKTTGTNQHRYDTYGQGRFGANPYDNLSLFMDQSAVFHAQSMNTPLLIFQGTNDGSTEWLQGVEFYNALRFLKKPVIFLSYEGEGHGFTRYDNQYDVEVRMHQFYDHYLKGTPEAEWIANGIPFIKKKAPTGAAAQPVQLMGGGAGIGTPTPGGSGGGGAAGGSSGQPPTGPPNP
jgi:dipeptidyl aminopeptidase/acylaminoacyl peptidase